MNDHIKNKVDELAQKPYGEVRKLLNNPYTWEFEEEGANYQGEIAVGYAWNRRPSWLR